VHTDGVADVGRGDDVEAAVLGAELVAGHADCGRVVPAAHAAAGVEQPAVARTGGADVGGAVDLVIIEVAVAVVVGAVLDGGAAPGAARALGLLDGADDAVGAGLGLRAVSDVRRAADLADVQGGGRVVGAAARSPGR
jgi:hypothetical protein